MLNHIDMTATSASKTISESAAKLKPLKKFLLRKNIEDFAKKIGFDLVGFSPAKIEKKYLDAFKGWLKEGQNGTMEYMEKIEQRADLGKILPGAKSVIVLAMNYYYKQNPLRSGSGRVARYAYGRDYHKIIKKLLKQVEQHIRTLAEAALTCSYVDTGPILERALAEQAGLGRIGKNTCLITKEYGSWVFLAEIITTLDLVDTARQKSEPAKISSDSSDRWSDPKGKSFNVCGNCTRCISACPTGAIIAPGVVDARLCISYLTIENKDKIPPKLAAIIKKTKRLYGCDICQEVCPHNEAREKDVNKIISTASLHPLSFESNPKIAGEQLDLKTLSKGPLKSDQQFLKTFAGSAVMRAKRNGLKRNLEVL